MQNYIKESHIRCRFGKLAWASILYKCNFILSDLPLNSSFFSV
jgi:hypothetical protein